MQSLLIEIVIAALLFFLLWSMDRGRSDLRFRFWVIGWSLVLIHLISFLWHPISAVVALLRQANFAALEVAAGVCFLLSDPAVIRSKTRMTRTALLTTIPATLIVFIILFRPANTWALYPLIVIAHVLAIALSRSYVGHLKDRFFLLAAIYFLSACWMLGALSYNQPQLVLAAIPAEIFFVNAFLFSRNYTMRNPGNLLAVMGFILWAMTSFATSAMWRIGTPDGIYSRALNLPQFLIAIGMTMIILEQDAAGARQLVREYELLFNNNPFPLWIYDLKTLRILSTNTASAKVHGYTVEELCRKKLTEVLHPKMLPDLTADIQKKITGAHHYSLHLRKDGSTVPLNVTAYDISFRGRPARIVLAEDISEREQMATQLMHQLQHDLLTGLPNRTLFLHKLDEIFLHANSHNSGCAAIVLHINRFERINESYGHRVGDQILKETTKLLQAQLHEGDALSRTGSREFTIALAAVSDGASAQARAVKILQIFDEPITIGEYKIEVSIRMGLAVFPEDSDDATALLRDAARAQALTQIRGADRFVRLSRELSLQVQEESRIEDLVQRALMYSGFEVFYQPIINTNGELHGLEALLRLHDEDGKMVSPNLFIPIAESTGTINTVGNWVIAEVCRQLREWQDAGFEVVPIAINTSSLQIVKTSFCADLMSSLSQFNIDPALVHLELTESSVMPQGPFALDNMLHLSERGIRFSIDDFGTGFSSLDRLHQLPVSILKIDRTFVTRMLDPDGTLPIVNTIISMAHSLNVGVVAEGVETKEQFHALYEMGCDQFQGYFFSKPVNAREAVRFLAREADTLASTDDSSKPTSMATTPFRPFPAVQFGSHLW